MDWIPELLKALREPWPPRVSGAMWIVALIAYFVIVPLVPAEQRELARAICLFVALASFVFWFMLPGGGWDTLLRTARVLATPSLREVLSDLSAPERLILTFALGISQRGILLPRYDSAVDDLERRGLILYRGPKGSEIEYEIPGHVWDYLRTRWKGRLTAAELDGTDLERRLLILDAIRAQHGR